jgi:hypothetical protein
VIAVLALGPAEGLVLGGVVRPVGEVGRWVALLHLLDLLARLLGLLFLLLSLLGRAGVVVAAVGIAGGRLALLALLGLALLRIGAGARRLLVLALDCLCALFAHVVASPKSRYRKGYPPRAATMQATRGGAAA